MIGVIDELEFRGKQAMTGGKTSNPPASGGSGGARAGHSAEALSAGPDAQVFWVPSSPRCEGSTGTSDRRSARNGDRISRALVRPPRIATPSGCPARATLIRTANPAPIADAPPPVACSKAPLVPIAEQSPAEKTLCLPTARASELETVSLPHNLQSGYGTASCARGPEVDMSGTTGHTKGSSWASCESLCPAGIPAVARELRRSKDPLTRSAGDSKGGP